MNNDKIVALIKPFVCNGLRFCNFKLCVKYTATKGQNKAPETIEAVTTRETLFR